MNEVRNLHPDPRCLCERGMWRGQATSDGEKYKYSLVSGQTVGSIAAWHPMTNQQIAGLVLYARITSDTQAVIDQLSIEGSTTIVKQDGWIAALSGAIASNRMLGLARGPFTLCEVGAYTPDDWAKLYDAYQRGDITYPWVAGPRNATAAGEKGPWEL